MLRLPQARFRLAISSALVLAATLPHGSAGAETVDVLAATEHDDPEEHAARALFAEAKSLAEAGRWAEARDRYHRSLEMKFAPETLYSLGVAQKQTGAFVEALASLERFLEEAPDSELEPFRHAARRAVSQLEGQVGRISVRVDTPPRGLSIAIDDEPLTLEQATAGRRVNPGHHTVQAIAPGKPPRVLTLAVTPGEHEHVRLDFDEDSPGSDLQRIGWTLVGVGAGLGAAGIVTAIVGATRPEWSDDGRAMTIAGSVVGSVGAFSTGLGVLFVLDQPSGEDVLASVEATPGGLGLRFDF